MNQNRETQTTRRTHAAKTLDMIWENLGPVKELFDRGDVDEIQINTPDDIWVRCGGVDTFTGVKIDSGSIEAACTAIASYNDKTVARKVTSSQEERQRHLMSAKLPGVRLEVVMPPVAVRGIAICLRKHNPKIITLEEYVASGVVTPGQAKLLRDIARNGETFMVSGPTYSGKTTLVNTILNEIPATKRLFLIEQIAELKIAESRNHARMECDPEHGVDTEKALKVAMRFSPHWIISGELRGPEAITFLEAANTGHAGGTTIHAESHYDALARLEDLALQAGRAMSESGLKARIARSVKWVVHIQLTDEGRKITGLCKVLGRSDNSDQYLIEDMTHVE